MEQVRWFRAFGFAVTAAALSLAALCPGWRPRHADPGKACLPDQAHKSHRRPLRHRDRRRRRVAAQRRADDVQFGLLLRVLKYLQQRRSGGELQESRQGCGQVLLQGSSSLRRRRKRNRRCKQRLPLAKICRRREVLDHRRRACKRTESSSALSATPTRTLRAIRSATTERSSFPFPKGSVPPRTISSKLFQN